MFAARPSAKAGSPWRAMTCAGVGTSVVIVTTLRPAAALNCATQGPFAPLVAASQVAALVPQKQLVTSPPWLQGPPATWPERMQAETAWQSAKPVGSLVAIGQQP